MNQDRITVGFDQFCKGAISGDLSLFGGYKAGYLRALSDSADAAQNLSTEVTHPAACAVLLGLADAMREANEQLLQRNDEK